jgi:fused signal recognition particle receptor
MLSAQDKDVLLGAADTFRAAAAEQLTTWGDRVGVPVVRGVEGSDPASVAFEAVTAGFEQEVDVVLIDTAGRLHTKQGLMDELGKLYRVAGKLGSVDEVLLVIDATTGQNGLTQAKVFNEGLKAYVILNRASTHPSVTEIEEAKLLIEDFENLGKTNIHRLLT